MRATVTDAIEAMSEGDRLLAQGTERLEPTGRKPAHTELALAEDSFERAARAYLAGAAEYQHAQRQEDHPRFASDQFDDLIKALDAQLAAEAVAALQAAKREPKNSEEGSVYQAQAFAENLRDRFSHALPELFHHPSDASWNRSDSRIWGR
jgi:hypothetical protein